MVELRITLLAAVGLRILVVQLYAQREKEPATVAAATKKEDERKNPKPYGKVIDS
jgi:hypothetical protein